jgi:hypothetical protein
MVEEIQKLKTILMSMNAKSAFDYVNSRYIYNPENYPAMKNLSDNEQKVFALKHTLLHMQKNIDPISYSQQAWEGKVEFIFERNQEQTSVSLKFREALVKMIVNYIKLAETLGISNEEFTAIQRNPEYGTTTIYGAISNMMNALALKCEAADHSGAISREDCDYLRDRFSNSWGVILNRFHEEKVPVPYDFIPDYMKSK